MTALPIVTAPYLARVLGANQLGIYSYTLSVANYFVLFSLLGIEKYGTRIPMDIPAPLLHKTKE